MVVEALKNELAGAHGYTIKTNIPKWISNILFIIKIYIFNYVLG